MQIPVSSGHYIRVRFHGETETRPSRYVASWPNWPSIGGTVRRTVEWRTDWEDMARDVAAVFADWLSAMPGDDSPLRFEPARVSIGSASDRDWAVIVHMNPEREA